MASDKSRVLCRYHMSGTCRFGADCAFSHDLNDLPSMVCRYYLAGNCAYGDRCRYDHRKPDYLKAAGAATGAGRPPPPAPHRTAGAASTSGTSTSGRGTAAAAAGTPTAAAAPAHAYAGASGPAHGSWSAAALSGGAAAAPVAAAVGAGHGGYGGGGGSGAGGRGGYDVYIPETGASYTEAAGDAYEYDSGNGEELYDSGDSFYYEDRDGTLYHVNADGEEERVGVPNDATTLAAIRCVQAAAAAFVAEGGATGGTSAAGAAAAAGALESGLVIVDDDEGLVAEAEAVAAAAAAAGAAPAEDPWAAAAGDGGGDADPVDPADVALCPAYSQQGRCAAGDACPLIHGNECEVCHKNCIHPYNPEASAVHVAACRLRHDRLEARLRSADVECGICLEPVLHKAAVSDRRFGLLSCDHPFCLSCIRSWRERTTDATLATDTAVRTCPICRTPTHFVTPSLVWPATPEAKAQIVDAYKAKLSTIDCRNWDWGNSTCPFGTSCFYRHMYRDGRMEETVLRRAGNADGQVRIVAPVRLSAFFDTPSAQRLLNQQQRR